MRSLYLLCLCLLLCPVSLQCDLAPWYGRTFEIVPKASYTYRHASSIARKSHICHIPLYGHFYRLAASVPVYDWSLACGMLLANSRDRKFGIDHTFASWKYRVLDDTPGFSPISLVVGGQLIFASKAALQDRISFHHGRLESLWHVSIGKEWENEQFWRQRVWACTLLGIADVGSPWVQCLLSWEQNRCEIDSFAFYSSFMYGFGGKSLIPRDFHGYGPIAHRSLDVGARYTRHFDAGLQASFAYSRTVYAYNFPRNTNSFSCCLTYPFGL